MIATKYFGVWQTPREWWKRDRRILSVRLFGWLLVLHCWGVVLRRVTIRRWAGVGVFLFWWPLRPSESLRVRKAGESEWR